MVSSDRSYRRLLANGLARSMRVGGVRSYAPFGYGLVAQGLSSLTNLGLIVLAAHVLGPAGVGTLFVGIGAYLVVLGLARALLADPLVATSAALREDERAATARFAMTLAVAGAFPIAALLATIGLALPATLGDGMLLFAPWLPFAIAQDMARVILFRDQRGRSAVALDATWLLTMIALAPVAFATGAMWAVSAVWGAGALASAFLGITKIGWRPSHFAPALEWWRTEASRLGRWLGFGSVLYSLVSYTSVLSVAGILGARDYGGLRAIHSLFAPLTMLAPAVSLPGLPLVSRRLAESTRRAVVASLKIGGFVTIVTVVYLAIVALSPGLLGVLFGPGFADFDSIILPVGLAQIVAAPALGLTLLLKAQQRGRALFSISILSITLSLVATVSAALLWGLDGAVWGGVVSAAVATTALAIVVFSTDQRRRIVGVASFADPGTPSHSP